MCWESHSISTGKKKEIIRRYCNSRGNKKIYPQKYGIAEEVPLGVFWWVFFHSRSAPACACAGHIVMCAFAIKDAYAMCDAFILFPMRWMHNNCSTELCNNRAENRAWNSNRKMCYFWLIAILWMGQRCRFFLLLFLSLSFQFNKFVCGFCCCCSCVFVH